MKLLESKEANHIEFMKIKNVVEEILLMHKNMQLNGVLNMLLEPTWAATGLKVDYETLVCYITAPTNITISFFSLLPEMTCLLHTN